MNHHKGNTLVILLTFLVLFSILFGGYIFWQNRQLKQTPNQPEQITLTQNNPLSSNSNSQSESEQQSIKFTCSATKWCEYSNNSYGFSLNYPQGWVVEEYSGRKDGYILAVSPAKKEPLSEKLNSYINNVEVSYYPSINNITQRVVRGLMNQNTIIYLDSSKIPSITMANVKLEKRSLTARNYLRW